LAGQRRGARRLRLTGFHSLFEWITLQALISYRHLPVWRPTFLGRTCLSV